MLCVIQFKRYVNIYIDKQNKGLFQNIITKLNLGRSKSQTYFLNFHKNVYYINSDEELLHHVKNWTIN